jgi:formate dehydrogenase subunit delta
LSKDFLETNVDQNNLVTMANRIGDFFVAMPDKTQALSDMAEHIKKFWDPRMRRALRSHIENNQGEGLNDFVLEALQKNATLWI